MHYGKIPDHRHRLIDAVGNCFIFGGACGSAFHLIRGLRGSPSGARLAGAAQDVLRNVPRHAGLAAIYSAMMCSLDTAMSLARRREDPWNHIAAGAATLALLNMRRGARVAAVSALVGAAVGAGPWGFGWYVSEWQSRLMSRSNAQMYLDLPRPVAVAPRSTAPGDSAGCSIEYK